MMMMMMMMDDDEDDGNVTVLMMPMIVKINIKLTMITRIFLMINQMMLMIVM